MTTVEDHAVPAGTAPSEQIDRDPKPPPAFGILIGISATLIPLLVVVPTGHRPEPGLGTWATSIAALVAFVALQIAITFSYHAAALTERIRLWLLVPMLGLAVAMPLSFGSRWMILFPYLAAAFAVSLPRRLLVAGLLLPVCLCAIVAWLVPGTDAVVIVIVIAAVAIAMATYRRFLELVAELRRTRLQLARAAVAEERLRFSRDIHDLLGHSLLQIVLKAQVTRRLYPAGRTDVDADLHSIEQMARVALDEVRHAVTGYRQRALSEAIDAARSALADANVDVVVQASATALPPRAEEVLSWVVREAVTNVVRHAEARHCEITVQVGSGSAVLEVTDDGRGHGAPAARAGTGLVGIAERVSRVGGRLVTGPRPAGGFRLRATVPVLTADGPS